MSTSSLEERLLTLSRPDLESLFFKALERCKTAETELQNLKTQAAEIQQKKSSESQSDITPISNAGTSESVDLLDLGSASGSNEQQPSLDSNVNESDDQTQQYEKELESLKQEQASALQKIVESGKLEAKKIQDDHLNKVQELKQQIAKAEEDLKRMEQEVEKIESNNQWQQNLNTDSTEISQSGVNSTKDTVTTGSVNQNLLDLDLNESSGCDTVAEQDSQLKLQNLNDSELSDEYPLSMTQIDNLIQTVGPDVTPSEKNKFQNDMWAEIERLGGCCEEVLNQDQYENDQNYWVEFEEKACQAFFSKYSKYFPGSGSSQRPSSIIEAESDSHHSVSESDEIQKFHSIIRSTFSSIRESRQSIHNDRKSIKSLQSETQELEEKKKQNEEEMQQLQIRQIEVEKRKKEKEEQRELRKIEKAKRQEERQKQKENKLLQKQQQKEAQQKDRESKLIQSLEDQKSKLSSLEQQISAITKEREIITTETFDITENNSSLKQEIEEIKKKIEEKKSEDASKAEETAQKLKLAEEKASQAKEEIRVWQETKNNLDQELEKKKQRREELGEVISDLEKSQKQLKAEIEKMKQESEEQMKKYDNDDGNSNSGTESDHQATASTSQSGPEGMQIEIGKLLQEIGEIKKKQQNLKDLQETEKEINALESEEQKLTNDLQEYKKEQWNFAIKLFAELKDIYSQSDVFPTEQLTTLFDGLERVLLGDDRISNPNSDPTSVPDEFELNTSSSQNCDPLLELTNATSKAVADSFQRLLEQNREKIKSLGSHNNELQSQLNTKKAELKNQIIALKDDNSDIERLELEEIERLQQEVVKVKQKLDIEKDIFDQESEKLQKYKGIMDQAQEKLGKNEGKIGDLKEQIQKKIGEHEKLSQEVESIKKQGMCFDQDTQVIMTVEVPLNPLNQSQNPNSNSTVDPSQVELWCLLKGTGIQHPNGSDLLKQAQNQRGQSASDVTTTTELKRCWWKADQVRELLPDKEIPVSVQAQLRFKLSEKEESVHKSKQLRDERITKLSTVDREFQAYKVKAATVSKLQQQHSQSGSGNSNSNTTVTGGQEETSAQIESVTNDNVNLREQIQTSSLEIQKLQNQNHTNEKKISDIRREILAICDALTQQGSQITSFKRQKEVLSKELSEKEEAVQLSEKYRKPEETGRKLVLDQEVEILRTLAQNLQLEKKQLQEQYESLQNAVRMRQERIAEEEKEEKERERLDKEGKSSKTNVNELNNSNTNQSLNTNSNNMISMNQKLKDINERSPLHNMNNLNQMSPSKGTNHNVQQDLEGHQQNGTTESLVVDNDHSLTTKSNKSPKSNTTDTNSNAKPKAPSSSSSTKASLTPFKIPEAINTTTNDSDNNISQAPVIPQLTPTTPAATPLSASGDTNCILPPSVTVDKSESEGNGLNSSNNNNSSNSNSKNFVSHTKSRERAPGVPADFTVSGGLPNRKRDRNNSHSASTGHGGANGANGKGQQQQQSNQYSHSDQIEVQSVASLITGQHSIGPHGTSQYQYSQYNGTDINSRYGIGQVSTIGGLSKLRLDGLPDRGEYDGDLDPNNINQERHPTVGWNDIMELRQLIRQYEQCLQQEKRDEELVNEQNEHIEIQLKSINSETGLKNNLLQHTQLEYIRNVFRKVIEDTPANVDIEHEQCIPVLLRFLEFDQSEQEEIRKKRQLKKENTFSGIMEKFVSAGAGVGVSNAVENGQRAFRDALGGKNPFGKWW